MVPIQLWNIFKKNQHYELYRYNKELILNIVKNTFKEFNETDISAYYSDYSDDISEESESDVLVDTADSESDDFISSDIDTDSEIKSDNSESDSEDS